MKRILGILGGMGPRATADFFGKIVNLTVASKDQDHIRTIIDSNCEIPDRNHALAGGHSPANGIQRSLNNLIRIGCQRIAMPCVTAHHFLPELSVPGQVLFLNMPEIVAKVCKEDYGARRVGILSSYGTAKGRVMANALDAVNVPYVEPTGSELNVLTKLIAGVKSGEDLKEAAAKLAVIANDLAGRGAGYFLLACTELPVIVDAHGFPHPCIDCSLELAKAAIRSCGYVHR